MKRSEALPIQARLSKPKASKWSEETVRAIEATHACLIAKVRDALDCWSVP